MTAKKIPCTLLSILLLLPFLSGASTKDRTAIARKYLTQEKNDAIRAAAIEYLKSCKQPECKKLLRAALHDASGVVRYRAIESLTPSADMIGLFIELLKDPDDRVWLCAVNGLIKIYTQPDPENPAFWSGATNDLIKIRKPLLEALKLAATDKDPFVREGAIVALGEIADTDSDKDPICVMDSLSKWM
jgi:HEAT repeat protein